LSSYDDFEYAKQVIHLNISAYLMKPVNETELLRVVKKVADEINEKRLE
jgi:two-component system response regulator YesN